VDIISLRHLLNCNKNLDFFQESTKAVHIPPILNIEIEVKMDSNPASFENRVRNQDRHTASPDVGRIGHTTASRDGSPKPRHSKPSINDSAKVPSLVLSIFGSRVCKASLKAGMNPPRDRLRSRRCGVAGCPSGMPNEPSRIQDLKD
jgi:hypothetical protein